MIEPVLTRKPVRIGRKHKAGWFERLDHHGNYEAKNAPMSDTERWTQRLLLAKEPVGRDYQPLITAAMLTAFCVALGLVWQL